MPNSVILWTVALQTSPSFTVSRSLLKFMSIESMMLSSHLVLCLLSLLLLTSAFPTIRVFSNELAVCIRWPKYWRLSFSSSPFNDYSGLISFRLLICSPCCPKDSQESSPAPQFKSINSSVFSLLYGATVISVHEYWKSYSSDYVDIC